MTAPLSITRNGPAAVFFSPVNHRIPSLAENVMLTDFENMEYSLRHLAKRPWSFLGMIPEEGQGIDFQRDNNEFNMMYVDSVRPDLHAYEDTGRATVTFDVMPDYQIRRDYYYREGYSKNLSVVYSRGNSGTYGLIVVPNAAMGLLEDPIFGYPSIQFNIARMSAIRMDRQDF